MYFDVRAAKLLTAGQFLMIDGCPGLRLAATATTRTWTYRYKARGSGLMKQVSLGRYPAMSVQSAASEWQRLRDLRGTGADPGEAKRDERRVIMEIETPPDYYSVRQLVDDYVSGHLEIERKEEGAAAATSALNRLLDEEPTFAVMAASDISRGVAFDLLNARKATPTATQKLRSMLGSAWEYALDSSALDGNTPNWWRQVMKGRLKSKGKIVGGEHVGQARRGLHDDELRTLLAWLPNMHSLGADTFCMYLWTCARGVEILGMKAAHITTERDGMWWTVPKMLTKNARFAQAVDLRVPLAGRAVDIVRRRMAEAKPGDPLFDGYTQHQFSTYIYDLQPYSAKTRRREGEGLVLPVANFSPHNLRRTSRTLLATLGCPKEIAEAMLGHLPETMDATYNSATYDKERRLWIERLSVHLATLTGLPDLP